MTRRKPTLLWQDLLTMFVLALPWMASSVSPLNPTSYWDVSPPINTTDPLYAGWLPLNNTRHMLIYDGIAHNRTYAHHPELFFASSTDTLYLSHSSAPIDEDSMGQDVWLAVSHDHGTTWSPSQPILPAALLPNQTAHVATYNFTTWCDAGIWQRALQALAIVQVPADGGAVYAVAQTTNFYCWGDELGSGTKAAGRIARCVDSSGAAAGDPCWLTTNNWTDAVLYNETVAYGGMATCVDAEAINAVLEQPASVPAWGDWLYNHELYAADGTHSMQENTHAVWVPSSSSSSSSTSSSSGGYWQRFWRDITPTNNTHAVWVETTLDATGASWYPQRLSPHGNAIYQTDIPDAQTKQFLGSLSTGAQYLVSNPRYDAAALTRQPLTVAVAAAAGSAFTGIGVLRTGADPAPVADSRGYKNVGFSYPSAVQVGERLVVAYSEDKQNVWVSLVDVADLP